MQDLEKGKIQKIAEQFTRELGSSSYSQFSKVLGLLAEGHPSTLENFAAELQISPTQAKEFLTQYGGEFDNKGDLVGLGLTLVPTPHNFEVNGHKMYAWCATDTLWFPALLNKSANVETVDPITGAKIRLTVSPQRVESIEPSTAVLSFSNYLDSKDVRGTFCNVGHWFVSRQTADAYISEHLGVVVLTADEVRRVLEVAFQETRAGRD